MKKIILIILISVFYNLILSQTPDTSYWKIGGITSLSFSQTSFKYWSAGGNNSATISGLFNVRADYLKNKLSFKNNLELGYGTQKSMGLPFRKTDDKIDFSSKFGYQALNKFYYSGLVSFKSQFTDGYEYLASGDSNLVSSLFAPAYLLYSVGIDYLPSKDFSVYTSPLTGKTTFVYNDLLSNNAAFGVDTGKNIRNEFGAYVKIEMNRKITDELIITSKLGLFSNYLHNPQNIDVNFDVLASLKITKFIAVTFQTQMIYDDDIMILVNPDTGKKGKRLQIKEIFGVGFSYNF